MKTFINPTPDSGGISLSDGRTRGRHAFSLIEITGVVAVISIAMLALLPAFQKQIEANAKAKEMSAMETIMGSLRDYVCAYRRIPGPSTFAQDMATQLGWLVSAVSTNARSNPRVFLVDPALRVGNPAATLPYVQGTNGSLLPVSPRVMLVSSLGVELPTGVTSGAATNAATFEQVWNSADYSSPTGWTGGGSWEDIRIQRLNLDSLFIPLILNNEAVTRGRYAVDASSHVALPSIPFSAYFIAGTKLGLHATDGTLQTVLVLQEFPMITNTFPYSVRPSFVYENGVWRGKLFESMTSGNKHNGLDLQAACDIFESGPRNVYQTGSLTQRQITVDMWNYMSNYVAWAASGFDEHSKGPVDNANNLMSSVIGTYCKDKASSH